MPAFDIINTTVRSGVTIDEVEFAVQAAPPATAYMLGRLPEQAQPVAIGLHHERGDKSTLLADLEHLAARGFLCLSIDSPGTRRAVAERDPLAAFDQQLAIAQTALNLLQGDPDTLDHRVAVIGRGIGGEVAAALAARTFRCQVVVALGALPRRSRFTRESPHPLAAGLRSAHDPDHLGALIDGLAPNELTRQLEKATDTHWLLQLGDDDDRIDDDDRELLAMGIPHAVRVRHHRSLRDLQANPARRERVDFVSGLCG